ncbi:MAG: radical SAM protein [Promethearchaeota archaeon]
MIDTLTALKKKTELLCKGLYLDKNFLKHYKSQGIEIDFGRKGGAGPSGGRYFLLEDQKTLVNVALWNDSSISSLSLKETENGFFKIYDDRTKGEFGKVKLIQNPKYYDKNFLTSDGIQMKKIALVHGVNCLATTIYQQCTHWACGEPCKFCGIQVTLESGSTIIEKNAQQICEVISEAKKEGRCSHMTLTTGTAEGEDKGARKYIDILKGIKMKYPKLPLHIQIEPVNHAILVELKEAGADTIGIHIEIVDELLRKVITPGKSKIPYSKFKDSWNDAIDVFGNNQVETFLLTGFGESRIEFLKDVENLITIGVIPYILPVRSVPGKTLMPIMNYNALLEIYEKTAKLMKQHGMNPLKNKAGCVRCGGCSAINEAYKAV